MCGWVFLILRRWTRCTWRSLYRATQGMRRPTAAPLRRHAHRRGVLPLRTGMTELRSRQLDLHNASPRAGRQRRGPRLGTRTACPCHSVLRRSSGGRVSRPTKHRSLSTPTIQSDHRPQRCPRCHATSHSLPHGADAEGCELRTTQQVPSTRSALSALPELGATGIGEGEPEVRPRD